VSHLIDQLSHVQQSLDSKCFSSALLLVCCSFFCLFAAFPLPLLPLLWLVAAALRCYCCCLCCCFQAYQLML
jgi:hypothetical protein